MNERKKERNKERKTGGRNLICFSTPRKNSTRNRGSLSKYKLMGCQMPVGRREGIHMSYDLHDFACLTLFKIFILGHFYICVKGNGSFFCQKNLPHRDLQRNFTGRCLLLHNFFTFFFAFFALQSVFPHFLP